MHQVAGDQHHNGQPKNDPRATWQCQAIEAMYCLAPDVPYFLRCLKCFMFSVENIGTYLKLSQFLSKTVADCLKLSQSSKIVAMCLNLSLILSHVPAPKAHTSQGTIHGYVHSWNDPAQPDPDPTGPLLPHHPARSSLPPQLHPARHARRPGPPCPPTRPVMPADPARQARQPAQPSRQAGTCPLLRLRCR